MASAVFSVVRVGGLALGLFATWAAAAGAQERAEGTFGATLGAGGVVVSEPPAQTEPAARPEPAAPAVRHSDRDGDAPPGMRRNASEAMVAAMAPPTAPVAPNPVVVELFTSQGCSACPPADELVEALAQRDDVIPLALHVDYWDYLGWEDPFAQPEFTARQKAYARAKGERTIYTPQMIVEGETALVGPQGADLERLIEAEKAETHAVTVQVSGGQGNYRILLDADPPLTTGTVVQIVRYHPQARVEILRGENAGKTVDYTNIVTAWHAVAQWDGRAPVTLTAKLDGADPAVLIVQTANPGTKVPLPGGIVAAARLQ